MQRSFSRVLKTWLLGVAAAGVTLGMVSSLSAQEPAGDDWPRFMGPSGDGKSTETGVSKRWDENGPPLLWQLSVGEGDS